MGSEELSSDDVVIADTNLFVAVGGPTKPKYRKPRAFAERQGVTFPTSRIPFAPVSAFSLETASKRRVHRVVNALFVLSFERRVPSRV